MFKCINKKKADIIPRLFEYMRNEQTRLAQPSQEDTPVGILNLFGG